MGKTEVETLDMCRLSFLEYTVRLFDNFCSYIHKREERECRTISVYDLFLLTKEIETSFSQEFQELLSRS